MNEKDKLVQDIAHSISEHRKLETEHLKRPDKNLAVALSNVHYMDADRKIWLTNKENLGGFYSEEDITGVQTGTIDGSPTTYTKDGSVVYKNSRIGETLIRHSSGIHQIDTPGGKREINIYNLSSFVPNPHEEEASDLVININERKPRRYQSLADLLALIQSADVEIEQLEDERSKLDETAQSDQQELEEIANRLERGKKRREEALNQAQSFIRKNAELRYQPILDPWQEEIKRSNIFNGTLAIDGGPGTGKTTALIQRIKFLTDREAMLGAASSNGELPFEDEGYLPNLSISQIKALFEQSRNWIFFTPNELLKLFLRNSMTQEGLMASDDRVLIWKDYLTKLIKQYKLVNTETQNPFLFLRQRVDEQLLPHDGKGVHQILKAFEKHFITLLNERLQKLLTIDVSGFSWKNQGLSIQNYVNRQEKEYSVEGLVRLYFNIQESYGEEVKKLTDEYAEILKNAGARVLKKLNTEPKINSIIIPFAEEWLTTTRVKEEFEDEDDVDLEDYSGDIEAFLFGKCKVLVKNLALSKYDTTVKLTRKYRELHEMVKPFLDIEKFEKFHQIGELAFFSKYFVRSTRGVVSNVISEIPKSYKSFRKSELSLKERKWNYSLLQFIVEENNAKNKRVHPEEQAMLIYFVNSTVARCYKVSKIKSKSITHSFFQGFRNNSTPVIGVDEATDFHIVDLLAIHSLSDLEISSVTYSGDIMQRLTQVGLRSWGELDGFIKKFDVKQLQISYRQSPTLLEVASEIYNRATGKEAEYLSFMDKDSKEPKPLLFKDSDEAIKVNWIAERILEIYHAYGSQYIPSIAIFLPKEGVNINVFAESLGSKDILADVGIEVRASSDGNVLGNQNTVRVFPVDYIKGMEFEAVFFHNLDGISRGQASDEMLMKNLYVGLSRATFYMGVTISEELADFQFFNDLFETEKLSWRA
jgi:hypothetical protein